jgi:hypothetical protein
MTPPDGIEAAPQNEVDAVGWFTREQALETLSYARDAQVLERLAD